MPELQELMHVECEHNKEWEYKSASAMKIFNMHKKKGAFGFECCQDMANAIVQNIDPAENNAIEKIELAQAGKGDPKLSGYFLNIHLKKQFIEDQIRKIYMADKVVLAQTLEESKD